jgi:MFS family permease
MAEQSRPRRSLLADIRPLRESPAFRRLWIGTSVSAIGGTMTSFAVTLQTYQLTHSSVAVGAIGLAQAVPFLVLGLFGGSFADAVDRRRLVLVTSGCLTVVSAAFAAQAFGDLRQLWLLYALAAVQAMLQSVNGPARRTFLPRLVPAGQVAAGVALNQLSGYISFLIGPVLAGIVAGAAGLRACYVIDTLSFGAALYGVAALPAMPPHGGLGKPGFRAVAEGLRYIRRHSILAAALLADLDSMILGMPIALFPALNAAHFGGTPQTLGLLTAGPAAGGLLGSALSGPAGRVRRQGRAMLVTVAIWGAAIAGFGFTHVLWLAVALLAIGGAADTTSVIFRGTIVQLTTPDRFRGRVTAVEFVIGGGGGPQLGNFEAGAVAALTSPAISAISGGLGCVAGAVAIRLAFPALARYRAADHLPPAEDQPAPASAAQGRGPQGCAPDDPVGCPAGPPVQFRS